LSVRDVPQEVLVGAKFDSPAIEHLASTIQQAQGVIVSSPVYKASYSGVLKALIDLLSQDILEHKPILLLMTVGSPAHLLAIEYTLKLLLASLKGQNLKGIYFQDSQISREAAIPINDEELLRRTMKQIDFFIDKLVSRNHHSLLHL